MDFLLAVKRFPSGRDREIGEASPINVIIESTAGKHADETAFPNFAVDGDLSTSAILNSEGSSAWLQLDFTEKVHVHKVLMYNEYHRDWFWESGCRNSLTDYRQCVDMHRSARIDLYNGEEEVISCGKPKPNYGLRQSDQLYTVLCNKLGRSVRLTTINSVTRVFELVVISRGERN